MSPSKVDDKQRTKFEGVARELGCDEDEAGFDAALRKVARHKPVKDAKSEPEKAVDGE